MVSLEVSGGKQLKREVPVTSSILLYLLILAAGWEQAEPSLVLSPWKCQHGVPNTAWVPGDSGTAAPHSPGSHVVMLGERLYQSKGHRSQGLGSAT